MDGWSGVAGTGGKLRAGIDGSGSVVAWLTRRVGTSRQGGQMGKPTAQIKPKLRYFGLCIT